MFRHRSFTEASIILDWHKIMKPELAERCYPERLIFPRGKREGGILVLVVDSGSSPLIQYSEDLLIDWINSYFGYQAVSRIKMKQTHINKTSKGEHKVEDTLENDAEEREDLQGIKDPDLKSALAAFQKSYQRYVKSKEKP